MRTSHPRVIACAALLGALGTGCATTQKILKAEPAPDSGFLSDADRMKENRERAPFNRMWRDPDLDVSKYDSIYVAPVNTDYVLENSEWAKMSVRQFTIQDDLKRIAAEFRQTVVDKFTGSKKNRFAIVDTPGEHTLILELAITELVPGKAFLGMVGVASWAAPPLIGVPVGAAASFADDGWMAIEGRVRDSATQNVEAMFADREKGKTRVIDLEAATWYGHAHESMNDWAEQFVLLANTPKDFQVEDSAAFTLLPW
jgi:uncharacterized protein DUF3313